MGFVEHRRTRSKIVTGITVLVLVWAAIATLLIGLSTLFSLLAPPPPNRAMESWLTDAETRPGPFLAFLFEFPLIVQLTQIVMFAVMTTAAVGTLRRRNEDRRLLCGVLIFYVLTRALNVYVAVTATTMPKGPNDQASLWESVITGIFAIAAVLFYRSQAVRSEFETARPVTLQPRVYRPQTAVPSPVASGQSSAASRSPEPKAGAAQPAVRPRPAPNQIIAASRSAAQFAILRTARAAAALRRASTWRGLLQLLLALALMATLLITTAVKATPYLMFTVAYALLLALLFLDRSPLPLVLSAVTAVAALAMALANRGERPVQMEPVRAMDAFTALNVAIIAASSLAFLLRERTTKRVEPPVLVSEPAMAIAALGRATLIVSATMMVLAGNSAMAWFTTTARLTGVAPPRMPAVGMIGLNAPAAVLGLIIGFWATMVWASIALLQRRMVGAVLLQIGAAILASLHAGEVVVSFASITKVEPRMWWMLMRMQFLNTVITAGAIAVIVSLRSARAQSELRSSMAAAPAPRLAKSEPLTVALQIYSTMYVVGMTLGMVRFREGVPSLMQWLWSLAALLTYDIRWSTTVVAICVAVWTLRATAARTSPPRRSEEIINFLEIGLTAYAVATLLQTLVVTIPATGNFRTLANALFPLVIAGLLWIPTTRLLGVAAAGAMFVLWSPLSMASRLPWTLSFEGESSLGTYFRVPMTILSSVVGICGLIAATYVFFTYAGRLPQSNGKVRK